MDRRKARMRADDARRAKLWALGTHAATLALAVAVVSAVFGWAPGALLVLGALALATGVHLVVAFSAYRAVMRRTWPEVQPLPDDDDW